MAAACSSSHSSSSSSQVGSTASDASSSAAYAASGGFDPSPDEIPPASPRPLKPFPLAQAGAPIPLQRSEPDDGSVLKQTPESIQLWFLIGDYDADHSWMELRGPKGSLQLGPMRLIGRRSLAADIRDALPDGDYVATWWAADDDGHGFKGTTKFTIKRS